MYTWETHFWIRCTDLTLFWIAYFFALRFLTSERNFASNYLKQAIKCTHYSLPAGKSCHWTLLENKNRWWVCKRDRISKTWITKESKYTRQWVSHQLKYKRCSDSRKHLLFQYKRLTNGAQSHPRLHIICQL